jgi:hypothetical protein
MRGLGGHSERRTDLRPGRSVIPGSGDLACPARFQRGDLAGQLTDAFQRDPLMLPHAISIR